MLLYSASGRVAIILDHGGQLFLCFVHQIPLTRLGSFRTQPLEHLSAAVKLPINRKVSGQPNHWEKSCEGKYCDGNWVYVLLWLLLFHRQLCCSYVALVCSLFVYVLVCVSVACLRRSGSRAAVSISHL